jgi:hypothetical protein
MKKTHVTKTQDNKAPESNEILKKLLEGFKIEGMDNLYSDNLDEADRLHNFIARGLAEISLARGTMRCADELNEQPMTTFELEGLQLALCRAENALQAGYQLYMSSR